MRCPDLRSRKVRRASGETRPLASANQPELLSKRTATDTRIKLHFDGVLGQQLAEYGLDRCWFHVQGQQAAQTVAELTNELKKALSLLGEQSDLQFRLDGFTVLSSTPLSFFRDGETVLIRCPPYHQQQNQEPVRLNAAKKRKRAPEVAGDTPDSSQKTGGVQKILKSAVKRAKSTSKAAGVTPSHAQQEVSAAAQSDQAGQMQDEASTHAQHKEDKAKRKRKRASELQTLPVAEAADAAQETDSEAGKEADIEAGTPAGDVGDKQPSRSARRKSLKRKYRRMGLAPAQALAASAAPAASVSAALAAAASASPFDPNGGQPHQGLLERDQQDTPGVARPAPKRQRIQAFRVQDVTCDPLKSHKAADGHVYFDASSDSDTELHRQLPNGGSAVASEHQEGGKAAEHAGATQKAAASGSIHAQVIEFAQRSACLQDMHQPKAKAASNPPKAAPNKNQPEQATAGHVTMPITDAENAALPVVKGLPASGDIVAYKLLEIGYDWTPQVSEWRHGEVAFDTDGSIVIKPLPGQGKPATGLSTAEQAHADTEEEAQEEEESPPSNYDDEGVLTTDRSCLTELRLLRASKASGLARTALKDNHTPLSHQSSHTSNPTSDVSAAATDFLAQILPPRNGQQKTPSAVLQKGTDQGEDGAGAAVVAPSSSSDVLQSSQMLSSGNAGPHSTEASHQNEQNKLNPKSKGQIVPSIGAWADLQSQLHRRRAELNGKPSAKPIPAAYAAPGSAAECDITAVATKSATAAGTASPSPTASDTTPNGMRTVHNRQDSVAMPSLGSKGAVRPRGGVRASAMGPLLNFLRSSGGLESEP